MKELLVVVYVIGWVFTYGGMVGYKDASGCAQVYTSPLPYAVWPVALVAIVSGYKAPADFNICGDE